MNFLHPEAFWGLLALSVPIIVHFFNLRKPRQEYFSNVALVREVKKSVVRRLKFRQWLLLLLRLLALAALVLAFAQPVWLAPESSQLSGNRSAIIVVDNSYSMAAGNERGAYFQQALSMARNIIKAHDNQDEFLIMGSSGLRLNYNFADKDAALEELKSLSISQSVSAHSDLIRFERDLFYRASNQSRQLYFLSDFQLSTVMMDSLGFASDSLQSRFQYIPLATRPQQNIYLGNHRIESRILEVGKPVRLSVVVVNDGERAVQDLGLRVILEGKVAAIQNLQAEAGSETKAELSFTPTSGGHLSGYIEIDDKFVPFDNRRFFSLYIPENEKVLVAEWIPSVNIRLLYQTIFESFETRIVASKDLSAESLEDYRTLILVGVQKLTTGMSEKLKSYLEEGGSVIFFPGGEMDLTSVNAFYAKLGLGSFEPAISFEEGAEAQDIDLDHPLFDGIFQAGDRSQSIDGPMVKTLYPYRGSPTGVQTRIISLEDRSPVLWESEVGNGLLYSFSVLPEPDWTDLQVKSLFPPLMYRMTQIYNQRQLGGSSQKIGDYHPELIRSQKQELIRLLDSKENEFIPEQYPRGGATIINFEPLDLKEGNYRVMQGDEEINRISFNIDDRESRLAYLDQYTLREYLDGRGFGGIGVLDPDPGSLSQNIRAEKEGIPFWKFFVLLALLFLLAEVILLKLRGRTQSGGTTADA